MRKYIANDEQLCTTCNGDGWMPCAACAKGNTLNTDACTCSDVPCHTCGGSGLLPSRRPERATLRIVHSRKEPHE